MVDLSKKQRRMAKAKVKGKTHKEIARTEYPNATEQSGVELVSRQLRQPHVAQFIEQEKVIALKKYNIGWDRIVEPINDAFNFTEGNPVQNMNIRLNASKRASELMDSKLPETQNPNPINIPKGLDEIEIQRMMFRKSDS